MTRTDINLIAYIALTALLLIAASMVTCSHYQTRARIAEDHARICGEALRQCGMEVEGCTRMVREYMEIREGQ